MHLAKYRRTLVLLFSIALGIYLLAIFSNDSEKILKMITSLQLVDWLIITGCALISYLLRLLDVIVVACMAILILYTEPQYQLPVVISLALLLLMLPVLGSEKLSRLIVHSSNAVALPRLATALHHLGQLLVSAHKLFQPAVLYRGLLLGSVAWIIQGYALYHIVSSFDIDITLLHALAIFAVSVLAGAISFIPGGIGTTEAVMGVLVYKLSGNSQLAIAVPIIARLGSIWFATLLGLSINFLLGILNVKQAPESHTEKPR